MERGGSGDERNCVVIRLRESGLMGGEELIRQKIGDGKELGLEDAIQSFKTQDALLAEKVGDVCLPKAGLAREHASGEDTAINPTNEFQTKALMELGKIHVWKVASQR